jgi:uroporphyrinogen decarboxylase
MSNILKTFQKENNQTPIWLMRQAGRYLPEYIEIRSSVKNFLELCYDSKKATEVTLQPIKRFGFDAAIIFSDILVLPHALGWDVQFKQGEGPILKKFKSENDLMQLSDSFSSNINYVYETVNSVKNSLPKNVSLIGFAGSPWTVISYMLEGKGKQDFSISKNFLYQNYSLAKKLFDIISNKTIEYLSKQIEAGADIIQLFDSWSGMLNGFNYEEFVIKPTKKIVSSLKEKYPHIPIIGFPRGSGYNYDLYINYTNIDAVGVDQFVPLSQMKKWQNNGIVIQGSLDPVILLSDKECIKNAIDEILFTLDNKGFIFNLGHGIMPNTNPNNVEYLVNYVREFKR